MACVEIHYLSSRSRSGCLLPINLATGELFDWAQNMTTVAWLAMNMVSGRNVRVVISNVRPFGKVARLLSPVLTCSMKGGGDQAG